MIENTQIQLTELPQPQFCQKAEPVNLTKDTMMWRYQQVCEKMWERGLDVLIVYADREHGGNFAYLTGFVPRFEEALLVLHRNGEAFLLLGNEMLRMAEYSRIPVKAIHVPQFSLPNQPTSGCSLDEALRKAGVRKAYHIGIAGWKLLKTVRKEEGYLNFDIPYYIVHSIGCLAGFRCIEPATDLFIDPARGLRIRMNANEIAHYEYGSSLASKGMEALLKHIEPGMTELELADFLEQEGQPNTVQTICASGERFTDAVVSPRNKVIQRGDRFSATVGYAGGLTNRTAYVAEDEKDLPEKEKDYVQKIAVPYFQAMSSWYEEIDSGVCAGDIYKLIEKIVPHEQYGWTLNPGHFIADEEWLSSPFFPQSSIHLASGMLLQMDLILKVPGYGGCNAEDGVVIMDSSLQEQMQHEYPQVWRRLSSRKKYMNNVLGICLKEDVFPMSDLCGYVRPYLLNKSVNFCVKK